MVARKLLKSAKPDARKAKTLDEACANGDGTYNGARLLSWLSEAINPGHGVSESAVAKIFEEIKHRRGNK